MSGYSEIIPATHHLLPPPCPECLWWQTTADGRQPSGSAERRDWLDHLVAAWGSGGLAAVNAGETVAALQFAPVRALPRAHVLPAGPPPREAVLVFCLRARIGRPAYEASRLLHRAMALLRMRGVEELWSYARPLGSEDLCGLRNLCGLEFLERNGFEVVRGGGDAFLMRADLRGLLSALKEAGSILRSLRQSGTPSPATWLRT